MCFSRSYHFKFFKGCLPQNLLSQLFNTFSHVILAGKVNSLFIVSSENKKAFRALSELLRLLILFMSPSSFPTHDVLSSFYVLERIINSFYEFGIYMCEYLSMFWSNHLILKHT